MKLYAKKQNNISNFAILNHLKTNTMCGTCGCGEEGSVSIRKPGEPTAQMHEHTHTHVHEHDGHSHEHGHTHHHHHEYAHDHEHHDDSDHAHHHTHADHDH